MRARLMKFLRQQREIITLAIDALGLIGLVVYACFTYETWQEMRTQTVDTARAWVGYQKIPGTIRVVDTPHWDTSPLASMNDESVISGPVILTGFSRIRGRLRCGKAMEMKKSIQEEVVHRSW